MDEVAGSVFCITGRLENFPTKAAAFEEIARRGGSAAKSLTTECNYLVLGAKGNENYAYGTKGTKQKRAEEWISRGHPIRIVTENQFVGMIEASEEVPDSERGKVLGDGPSVGRRPVTREEIGSLRCSEAFWEPAPSSRQVLRITYESEPLSNEKAQERRRMFQAMKAESRELGLKSSVRTELYPAGWSLSIDQYGECHFLPEDVVLAVRIVAELDNDETKAAGRQLAQQIKERIAALALGGDLSLRIWDETYRYGRHWLEKLNSLRS